MQSGECKVRGDDISGIGVHIGTRVSALAAPNDVLVSSTLRDLVIGSGSAPDQGKRAARHPLHRHRWEPHLTLMQRVPGAVRLPLVVSSRSYYDPDMPARLRVSSMSSVYSTSRVLIRWGPERRLPSLRPR